MARYSGKAERSGRRSLLGQLGGAFSCRGISSCFHGGNSSRKWWGEGSWAALVSWVKVPSTGPSDEPLLAPPSCRYCCWTCDSSSPAEAPLLDLVFSLFSIFVTSFLLSSCFTLLLTLQFSNLPSLTYEAWVLQN